MGFVPVPNNATLVSGQVFQVEITWNVAIGFGPDYPTLQSFLDTNCAVTSTSLVRSNASPWSLGLTGDDAIYSGTIQDENGYTAGQLQTDIYNAIGTYNGAAGSTSGVMALSQLNVSGVSVLGGSAVGTQAAGVPSAAAPSGSTSTWAWAAIAIAIAIVAVVFFGFTKEVGA